MAAEVGVDVGRRRRLPPWMQGVAAADQGCKSGNKDEENVSSELANSSFAPQLKRKSRAERLEKEGLLCDKELGEVDSSLLVKCAKKLGKKNLFQRDVDSDSLTHNEDEVPKKRTKRTCGIQRKSRAKRLGKEAQHCDKELGEVDSSSLVKCAKKWGKTNLFQRDVDGDCLTHNEDEVPKKRTKRTCGTQRAVWEAASEKKRGGKNYRVESSADIPAPSPSEEDGELTMEDLMSIAEEYVKADNDINNQPSEREEATSVTQPLADNFSSIEIESGGSLKYTQSSRGSSNHLTESSTSSLSKTGFNDQDHSISKSIITDLSRTGDPTQDMLDLFLGPLLKKPQKEEKKMETTTEEILAYEFRKQSESKSVETEVVPLVKKKKSSLKDKISMFLD